MYGPAQATTDQTCSLTLSQYTDTRLTSHSTDTEQPKYHSFKSLVLLGLGWSPGPFTLKADSNLWTIEVVYGAMSLLLICLLACVLNIPAAHTCTSETDLIVKCCHTEKEVADHPGISPSHSILTLGQPVPALMLYRQASRQGSHWRANL